MELRRAGEKVKDLDGDRLNQIDTQEHERGDEGRKILLMGFGIGSIVQACVS